MVVADAAAQARFFGAYAKNYGAGAFATPTRKEIEAEPGLIVDVGDFMVAQKLLTRDSSRTDIFGDKFTMEEGAWVATHVARGPDNTIIPDLTDYTYVMSYVEDELLTFALEAQGFSHYATRMTSASELIRVWYQGPEVEVPAYDRATVTEVPVPLRSSDRAAIKEELGQLFGWADDVPLYSDGSWSALTLRGYYPLDPQRNAKPAEQDRKWKAAHPEDLELPCVWTILSVDCPAIVEWVESVPWWESLERVRLLRMTKGKLGRHTDILDRNGGTRDGQIVRFHLPIVTHPDIKMTNWDLDGNRTETHLEQWKCYYLDTRKPHAVANPTDVERVHLVVDVVCNDEVRAKLA